MLKNYDKAIMKGVALCVKPYLKPEEAMIYTNLERTRLALKCQEYGIYKNANGYYSREDLDLIVSGAPSKLDNKVDAIVVGTTKGRRKRTSK
jgi:hypothetical protein